MTTVWPCLPIKTRGMPAPSGSPCFPFQFEVPSGLESLLLNEVPACHRNTREFWNCTPSYISTTTSTPRSDSDGKALATSSVLPCSFRGSRPSGNFWQSSRTPGADSWVGSDRCGVMERIIAVGPRNCLFPKASADVVRTETAGLAGVSVCSVERLAGNLCRERRTVGGQPAAMMIDSHGVSAPPGPRGYCPS